jgi:trehalose 6-phosphate phosphatase
VKRLFDCLPDLEPVFRDAEHLWIGADFDGTLSAIAPTPEEAVLDEATRHLLTRLAGCRGTSIAVISGRALDDVRRKVGVEGIAYAGNHGLEIEGPGFRRTNDEALICRADLDGLTQDLAERLARVPGVRVEEKGLTASVHVRNVDPERRAEVRRTLTEAMEQQTAFVLRRGRMVWEIRPAVRWDKGRAAAWLMERQSGRGAAALYVGDDETDEDAFRALRAHATVLVGPERESRARYRIETQEDLPQFFDWLLRMRSEAAPTLGALRDGSAAGADDRGATRP